MKKLIKWLEENNIKFTYTDKGVDKYITITLEEDAVWVNGFGEDMHYTKVIRIWYSTYKVYTATETTGYNLYNTLAKSTKVDNIIKALAVRFGGN